MIEHFYKNKEVTRSKVFCPTIRSILNEIFPDVNSKLIDVGCAFNLYKQFYPKLIGIDIVHHENADIITSINNFNPKENSFDGAICLGVFHGEVEYVYKNFKKMLSWIKKDGYIVMRCRSDIPMYEINLMNPLHWNNETIIQFEEIYNLKRIEIYHTLKRDKKTSNVWVWQKN